MKIVLISPPFGEKGEKTPVAPVAPPTLEYLAGLTLQYRPDALLELIDANQEDIDPFKLHADLVGITVHTVQAPWAYKTANILKQRGIPVILGGVHVSALPKEAAPHAHALVVGEAESVWNQVLEDLQKGSLRKIYHGERLPLGNLPSPVTTLLRGKYRLGSFFTARGCPNKCKFCSVNRFFGGKVRFRPIDEVIYEVATSARSFFWNLDDNCWGTNVNRSIELYKEMAATIKGKYWFGMGDLRPLDDPHSEELLKWARRAGMTSIRVGWESNNPQTLDHYNASRKQGRTRIDAIKRIRAAGIDVILFVIVGGLQDTHKDFESITKLSEELDVTVRPVMFTPLPDTELFEEYAPYLIKDFNWDRFDGFHAVFDHPTMTLDEREKALVEFWQSMYTVPKILYRLSKVSMKGFPSSHLSSFMVQFFESKAYKNL